MNGDELIAKINQSGARLWNGTDGKWAVSNDIASLRWLLDIGVIDAIERGGRLARYKGKVK